MRFVLPALVVLLSACHPSSAPPKPAAAAPPTAIAPLPTTRITRVMLGTHVDAEHRVESPTLQFSPSDTLFVSAELTAQPQGTHTIGVRWFYTDSKQLILEEQQSLVIGATTYTHFQLSKPDGWPVGQYKVELLLDGKLEQTRLFEVK